MKQHKISQSIDEKKLQNFLNKSVMEYDMFGELFSKAMKTPESKQK